jgi:hypothetical protein
MSCPFKPAKETVSLHGSQQVFSSKDNVNEKQYRTETIEQNIGNDTNINSRYNLNKGDIVEYDTDVTAKVKPAKKTVSLQDSEAASVQKVFSSMEQLPAPQMGDNDRQYSTESIEQSFGNDANSTDNLNKVDIVEGDSEVAVKVRSDLSPEEEFRSALQQQSKAVYEEMKYDCDVIEQEIGVYKQVIPGIRR